MAASRPAPCPAPAPPPRSQRAPARTSASVSRASGYLDQTPDLRGSPVPLSSCTHTHTHTQYYTTLRTREQEGKRTGPVIALKSHPRLLQFVDTFMKPAATEWH